VRHNTNRDFAIGARFALHDMRYCGWEIFALCLDFISAPRAQDPIILQAAWVSPWYVAGDVQYHADLASHYH